MENQENEVEQKETNNPEQFKAGQASEESKLTDEDDADYTEDEVEYADGKGTQLNEEFDIPDREDLEDDFESDLDNED